MSTIQLIDPGSRNCEKLHENLDYDKYFTLRVCGMHCTNVHNNMIALAVLQISIIMDVCIDIVMFWTSIFLDSLRRETITNGSCYLCALGINQTDEWL